MAKARECGLPHQVRGNEERTRFVVKAERAAEETRQLQKKRLHTQLGSLCPPNACLSPRGPTMAQACRTTEGVKKKWGEGP